jgi:hypothetical protein
MLKCCVKSVAASSSCFGTPWPTEHYFGRIAPRVEENQERPCQYWARNTSELRIGAQGRFAPVIARDATPVIEAAGMFRVVRVTNFAATPCNFVQKPRWRVLRIPSPTFFILIYLVACEEVKWDVSHYRV